MLYFVIIIISFFITINSVFASDKQDELLVFENEMANLESLSRGRIGVSFFDTANNKRYQYRGDERFPLCSTAKLMTVSAVLKRSMNQNDFLEQKIVYKKEDLVSYSPITEKHFTEGMSIGDLCEAAIVKSDNTAMNLLTNKIGGVQAVTQFARFIGDNVFRLDRLEPELNSAIPEDLRDTSTPIAMEKSLHRLCIGDALALPQRKQLQSWLKSCSTGESRIRAGVPKDWMVGDKTGTGAYGTTNDVAIIWTAKNSPIILAIYFTHNNKDAIPKDDVIESVTRILINTIYPEVCHDIYLAGWSFSLFNDRFALSDM